jgi:hypothetical protein
LGVLQAQHAGSGRRRARGECRGIVWRHWLGGAGSVGGARAH